MCKYPNLKSSTGYSYGCRCDKCRLWHNARSVRYRHENPEKCYTADRKWQKNNREKVLGYRKKYALKYPEKVKNNQLKNKFGITVHEYNQLLEKQNNQCAICKRYQYEFSKLFAVDHCHQTGKIRGLLCHSCNTALGHFQDKLEILDSAVNYLIQFQKIGC